MSDYSTDDVFRIEFDADESALREKRAILEALRGDARVIRVRAGIWFVPGRPFRATIDVVADTAGAASAVAFEAARVAMERRGRRVVSESITQSTAGEPAEPR